MDAFHPGTDAKFVLGNDKRGCTATLAVSVFNAKSNAPRKETLYSECKALLEGFQSDAKRDT